VVARNATTVVPSVVNTLPPLDTTGPTRPVPATGSSHSSSSWSALALVTVDSPAFQALRPASKPGCSQQPLSPVARASTPSTAELRRTTPRR
jgi:hypothetical protein